MIHLLFLEIIVSLVVGASAFTILYVKYAKGKRALYIDALHFDVAYLFAILLTGAEEYLIVFSVETPTWLKILSVFLQLCLSCIRSVFMVRIAYAFSGRKPTLIVRECVYFISIAVLAVFLAVIALMIVNAASWKDAVLLGRDLMNLYIFSTAIACDIYVLFRRREILPGFRKFAVAILCIGFVIVPLFVMFNPADIGVYPMRFPDMNMVGFFTINLAIILFSLRGFRVRANAVPEPVTKAMPKGMTLGRFSDSYGISERECEILELVVQGKTNAQIAKLLFLSPHTVKNHLYNAYKKLGVANRMMLVKKISP